jgi:hypothetical protein
MDAFVSPGKQASEFCLCLAFRSAERQVSSLAFPRYGVAPKIELDLPGTFALLADMTRDMAKNLLVALPISPGAPEAEKSRLVFPTAELDVSSGDLHNEEANSYCRLARPARWHNGNAHH